MRAKRGFYIFCFAMIALFLALGFWQLQRLEQKRALLEAMQNDARVFEGVIDRKKPVFMTGTTNPDPNAPVTERLGYEVYFPVRARGLNFLADFGFALEADRKKMLDDPSAIFAPVSGQILPLREKRFFTPENDPLRGVWYWHDLAKLEEYAGYKLAPFILYSSKDWRGEALPPAVSGIPNNHAQYALTWFALAAALLVWTMYYRRKTRS